MGLKMSQSYAESLKVGTIDKPGEKIFDEVYNCYSKVFTLESERESRENFEAILASNTDESIVAGKSKEMWVYLQNEEGTVVAASNFDCFAGNKAEGIDGTIHAIYVFVAPEFRQAGVFERLNEEMLKAAADYTKSVIPGTPEKPVIPIIAEQNAPFRMTAEEYLADNEAAGIDQVVRRVVFERKGYRTLDCRYIQPPLSEEQGACTYLDMVARTSPDVKSLPSAAIKEHLERFFTLSFPEGTTLDHPDIAEMKASLDSMKDVKFNPPGKFTPLIGKLNVEDLAKLPEQDKPLGEVYPDLFAQYQGKTSATVSTATLKAEELARNTQRSESVA